MNPPRKFRAGGIRLRDTVAVTSKGRPRVRRPSPYVSICTTTPSRSFGSNQVDFGGMIFPASAICQQFLDGCRMQRECHRHLSGIHPPLELSQSADPTDEIDPLARARIVDARGAGESSSR